MDFSTKIGTSLWQSNVNVQDKVTGAHRDFRGVPTNYWPAAGKVASAVFCVTPGHEYYLGANQPIGDNFGLEATMRVGSYIETFRDVHTRANILDRRFRRRVKR